MKAKRFVLINDSGPVPEYFVGKFSEHSWRTSFLLMRARLFERRALAVEFLRDEQGRTSKGWRVVPVSVEVAA